MSARNATQVASAKPAMHGVAQPRGQLAVNGSNVANTNQTMPSETKPQAVYTNGGNDLGQQNSLTSQQGLLQGGSPIGRQISYTLCELYSPLTILPTLTIMPN